MGWYYYLDGRLRFPFQAKCVRRAATSPLRVGEIVTITKMAPENDCGSDMVVLTRLSGRSFGVPLSQLQPCDVGYRYGRSNCRLALLVDDGVPVLTDPESVTARPHKGISSSTLKCEDLCRKQECGSAVVTQQPTVELVAVNDCSSSAVDVPISRTTCSNCDRSP